MLFHFTDLWKSLWIGVQWQAFYHLFSFFCLFLLSGEDIGSENLISCFCNTSGSLSHCRFSRNQVPFWGWWCPPWCPDLQIWRTCWRPLSWWCCTWCLRWCPGLRRWLWSSPLVCLPGLIQGRRAGSFLQVNIHLHPKAVKTREMMWAETGQLQINVPMCYWTSVIQALFVNETISLRTSLQGLSWKQMLNRGW